MESRSWDLFATTDFRTVYYFTGHLGNVDTPVLFAAWREGKTLLIGPEKCDALVTEVLPLTTYSTERIIDYPERDMEDLWARYLYGRATQRAGIDRRSRLHMSKLPIETMRLQCC